MTSNTGTSFGPRLIVGIGLLLLGSVIAINLYQEWHRTFSREQDRLLTQARVIQVNIGENLKSVNKVLDDLGKEIPKSRSHTGLNQRLKMLSDAMPAMRTLIVLDAEGTIQASNREEIIGKNFNQRPYFKVPQQHHDADTLYISPPFRTVLGTFTINVSRMISGANGEFVGVVTAALDPAYFSPLLDSIRYAPDMWVAIAQGNGDVFMMVPEKEGVVGKNVAAPDTFFSRHRASGAAATVHAGIAFITGDKRLLVWHTVQKPNLKMDVPLMVAVARDYDDVFAPWRRDARTQGGLYGLLVLSFTIGLYFYQRRQEQRLITENALALSDQRLREKMQELNTILDNSSVGISLVKNRQIVWANQRMGDLFGYPQPELSGMETRLFYTSQEAYENFGRQAYPTLAEGKRYTQEQEMQRRDGKVVWMRISGKMIPEDHSVGGSIWVFEDITEQKLVEAALRESEATYRALFESSTDALAIIDPQAGRYIDCNAAAVRLHGMDTREGLIGTKPSDLSPPFQPNGGSSVVLAAEHIQKALTESADTFEWQHRKIDGSTFPILVSLCVLPLKGKKHILVIGRNITDQKNAESEMLRAKLAAESANQAKSAFLATMSHEIRTPMNGVLGMAQLLLMPEISEQERSDYARTILNSGQTLMTLLNDILDFSKVEAGKLELVPAVFDPEQILDEITSLFMEATQSKGLQIDAGWLGQKGQRYRADPARLRQMLSNLVSNAIKFTAHGFVQIRCAEIERSGNAALLEFSVTDSGIGIPAETQSLLFQPFSQADSTVTREYGGTGLGLSIVRSLAQVMGGGVGVESAVGKGSRFWFRIRAETVLEGQEQRRNERNVAIDDAQAGTVALAGHVLVVEDNLTNRKVIEALLGRLGIQAECVENGLESLNAITGGLRPDMILMDIQMPVMGGLEATEKIRQWENETHQPRLPIVALTAGAFADDRESCIDAGMDDFLAKPINMNDLASTLAKWLGMRKQEQL